MHINVLLRGGGGFDPSLKKMLTMPTYVLLGEGGGFDPWWR